MHRIIVKKSAEKELEKLPQKAVRQISLVIDSLAKNPRPVGCKKLEGQKESLWRVRSGDYRIVYSVDDTIKIIEVRRIGHRKDIYS